MREHANPNPGRQPGAPVAVNADVAILQVHVQPRASRTEVVGWHGDAIKIRVKAPPVDGAANEELVKFLAKQLGVARSDVAVTSGAGSRTKRVRVEGLSTSHAARMLVGDAR